MAIVCGVDNLVLMVNFQRRINLAGFLDIFIYHVAARKANIRGSEWILKYVNF